MYFTNVNYLDDTFILFNDASHAPLFLEYVNSRHPNIDLFFFYHFAINDDKQEFSKV